MVFCNLPRHYNIIMTSATSELALFASTIRRLDKDPQRPGEIGPLDPRAVER
jgi:hypothetical protein